MKLTSLRRTRVADRPGVTGTARLDRRTRNLAKRLQPGDIAVIDHIDIDRGAAMALVEARVAGVINLAPSISGRYPNLGPQELLEAGIVLVDNVGHDAFTALNDGDTLRIDGDTVYRGDTAVACGVRQDSSSVAAALEASKDGIASQLEAFSANAVEHLRRERGLLLDGEGVPTIDTAIEGRQVLIVVRAFDYRRDLAALKTYIRENSPVLVGVNAGADALLESGHRPDLIVTDAEEISDRALRCGAEVVAHASRDGRLLGKERLERLGVKAAIFAAGGTAEDAALLLAYLHDASLIVVAGSHSSLLEFLDKGRSGMASAFLTRAAVGSRLVDAKAVAQIYQHRIRSLWVVLVVLLALAAVAAAIATTPVGQQWWDAISTEAVETYEWCRDRLR
jgi:uncharacterized membrane-anchored protein